MINDEAPVIFDVKKKPPMRKRSFFAVEGRGEDGKPSSRMVSRTERRPNGRWPMVIDSAGNELPLKTSNALSVAIDDDPYGGPVLRAKSRANPEWETEPVILSTACPQLTEWMGKLPLDLRTGNPCTIAEDGKHAIGEDRQSGNIYHCQCIAEVRRRRQKANEEREARRDPKTSRNEALAAGNFEAVARLTELVAGMERAEAARAAAIAAAAAKEPAKK